MDESLSKVAGFIAFIILGALLRHWGVLRREAFHAISGLVLYVTLPCVIITNLNGVRVAGEMLLVAICGFVVNCLFLAYAFVLTRKQTDDAKKDFTLLNFSGFSIGPMAVPFVQAFYPTTGLMTACMFEVGNVIMSGGGTYAIISGRHQKGGLQAFIRSLAGKLVRSGPLMAFVIVVGMSTLGLRFPDAVTQITSVGGAANAFLCMIMIGESIDFSLEWRKFRAIARILAHRLLLCAIFAATTWFVLPFEGEVRLAMFMCCLAPIPAMSLIYTAAMKGDIAMAAVMNSISVVIAVACMSVAVLVLPA